jgi:PadR family transcriptional regulator PadR
VKGETLKGHLDTLLLAAVAECPSHGYRLIEHLRSRSDGAFNLAEGTMYPALHRLERAGLLRSSWTDGQGRRRRREYELTRDGTDALDERRREWERFSAGMAVVLAGAEQGAMPSTERPTVTATAPSAGVLVASGGSGSR